MLETGSLTLRGHSDFAIFDGNTVAIDNIEGDRRRFSITNKPRALLGALAFSQEYRTVIKFPQGEEGRRRRKLAAVALALAVPYVTWAAWPGGIELLPSRRWVIVVFLLNFAICWGILMLYRRHLYKDTDKGQ